MAMKEPFSVLMDYIYCDSSFNDSDLEALMIVVIYSYLANET